MRIAGVIIVLIALIAAGLLFAGYENVKNRAAKLEEKMAAISTSGEKLMVTRRATSTVHVLGLIPLPVCAKQTPIHERTIVCVQEA